MSGLRCRGRSRWIDPDPRGEGLGLGDPVYEAFRVLGRRLLESLLTPLDDLVGSAVMDIVGGEHGDAAVVVLAVVAGKEGSTEVDCFVDVREAACA